MSSLPFVSPTDEFLRYVGTCRAEDIETLSSMPGRRHQFPIDQALHQATSDRLALAGEHLRAGDDALLRERFRASISRHYYAMYHAARAIVFGVTKGDDYERHNVLPRNLPAALPSQQQRGSELTAARLLRNEADYDPYPSIESGWDGDARALSVTSAAFVQACEDFALANGLI